MCEHGMIQPMPPAECRSMTTSAAGNSTLEKKWASCSIGGPSGLPGKERLKFAPDGHSRVCAREASVEMIGTMMIRPETCAGSISWIRRRAAICPSYSSPWLPAEMRMVGPVPLATDTIGTRTPVLPVLGSGGSCRYPVCRPSLPKSIGLTIRDCPA
jgi:hypothetical protein